jgi:hypothetical protein
VKILKQGNSLSPGISEKGKFEKYSIEKWAGKDNFRSFVSFEGMKAKSWLVF